MNDEFVELRRRFLKYMQALAEIYDCDDPKEALKIARDALKEEKNGTQ